MRRPTIDVTTVNDAPSGADRTITALEDTARVLTAADFGFSDASAIKVADIAITDVDGGTNNLSLSGLDAALFRIVGNALFVKAGARLDFETNPLLNVTVNVNDPTVGGPVDASRSLAIKIGKHGRKPDRNAWQ